MDSGKFGKKMRIDRHNMAIFRYQLAQDVFNIYAWSTFHFERQRAAKVRSL